MFFAGNIGIPGIEGPVVRIALHRSTYSLDSVDTQGTPKTERIPTLAQTDFPAASPMSRNPS